MNFAPQWIRFLTGRLERDYSDITIRRYFLLNGYSMVGIMALAVYICAYAIQGRSVDAIIQGVFIIVTLLNLIYLQRTQRADRASLVLITLLMTFLVILLLRGGFAHSGIYWMYTLPVLTYSLLGTWAGFRWNMGFAAMLAALVIGQVFGLLVVPFSTAELWQADIGFLVLVLLMFGFSLTIDRYSDQSEEQKARISFEAQVERSLEQEYRKFKSAVDHASDHIIITDPQGTILYANNAVADITGYSRDEAIGHKAGPSTLWGGQMPPEFYRQMWRTIKDQRKKFHAEVTNKKKSGERYQADLNMIPLLNDRGDLEFIVEVQRDITQEKAVDRAKTEFVSLASHQLTTPLSSISWYIEMLMAGDAGKLTPTVKKFVSAVDASTQQMVHLITALLNTTRIDLGTFMITPEPTEVARLVLSIVDDVRRANPGSAPIKTQLEHIPPVAIDPTLFRIIIDNLVTNAVRYSPPNSAVVVQLRRLGQQWSVIVEDHGLGIPADEQSKIFGKMFRARNAIKERPNGNGLGLYIAKAIVDQAGGSLTFTSVEKKGTTFTVSFPMTGMKAKSGSRQLS